MKHILKDIVCARNSGAHISALALALTIPNILSNIEHGKRTYKNEYIEWFNKWVYKYYKQPESDDELINKGIEATKFDGTNCYALRCALLHAGNTNLKEEIGKIDYFILFLSKNLSTCGNVAVCNVSNEDAKDVYVWVNVDGLINSIIKGAEDYVNQNMDKMEENDGKKDCRKVFGGIEIKYI